MSTSPRITIPHAHSSVGTDSVSDLLSDGLRVNKNFFKYFGDEYQSSPYHYSKDNKYKENFPHHMVLPESTVCAINADEKSPWELIADNNRFYILNNGKKITEVNFPKKYTYLDKKIDYSCKVGDIGFVTTPHSLNIFTTNTV